MKIEYVGKGLLRVQGENEQDYAILSDLVDNSESDGSILRVASSAYEKGRTTSFLFGPLGTQDKKE